MKNKIFIWIFVFILLVPISFGATFCDSGNCCDDGIVVTAKTLTTSYSCDKHSNNLLKTTVNCDGLSADSTTSTAPYLECNSTQYCDEDERECMNITKEQESEWYFDELNSEDPDIFKKSRDSMVRAINEKESLEDTEKVLNKDVTGIILALLVVVILIFFVILISLNKIQRRLK